MRRNCISILVLISVVGAYTSCAVQQKKNDSPAVADNAVYKNIGIEKKYLAEGLITDETYRVVIVSSKDSSEAHMGDIAGKAKHRARVSLERAILADHVKPDRNARAEIVNLIENYGLLYKKDLNHEQYDVYYFEIRKKNLRGQLKNISLVR